MNKPDYRLLKDTIEIGAGAVFKYNENAARYELKTENGFLFYRAKLVENSPEWFEKVGVNEYTDSDMLEFANEVLYFFGIKPRINLVQHLKKWKEAQSTPAN